MNAQTISLAFNWHNFWSVWAGLGYIVGIAIWWIISVGLVYFCCISAFGNDDDTAIGCVSVPVAFVWFALSAAVYAGMH